MKINKKIYKELDRVERKIENNGDFRYLSAYKEGLEFALNLLSENNCYRCGGKGVILKATKKGIISCNCPDCKLHKKGMNK
jgi:hypothetical protein